MKQFVIMALFSVSCCVAFSQTVESCLGEAIVKCPKEWKTNMAFNYEVTIPQKDIWISSVLSDFGSMNVIYGPSISHKHTVQISRGKRVKTDSVSYLWKLVSWGKGAFVIPSFKIMNNTTQEYYTTPETPIVLSDNFVIAPEPLHPSTDSISGNKPDMAEDIIFQWKIQEAQDIFVGNKFSCQLELLSNLSLSQINDLNNYLPDNAYTMCVDTSNIITPSDTIIDGKMYRYYMIKKFEVVPLKAGNFLLPSAAVKLFGFKSSGDIINDFFNDGVSSYEETICAEKLNIQVKKKSIDVPSIDVNHSGIAVCCDVSSSMQSIDSADTRLMISNKILTSLKNEYTFHSHALYMAFAGAKEYDWCTDITQYTDSLKAPLKDGTALYDAMVYPLSSFDRCTDVIVITDGMDNSSHITSDTMYEILKEYKVRPHVVFLNSMADSVMYHIPNTFDDGTATENHFVTFKVINEKPSFGQLAYFQELLQSLGGSFHVIKDEKDIKNVVEQLIAVTEDTNRSHFHTNQSLVAIYFTG